MSGALVRKTPGDGWSVRESEDFGGGMMRHQRSQPGRVAKISLSSGCVGERCRPLGVAADQNAAVAEWEIFGLRGLGSNGT